jgi:hypothetical protein
MAEIAPSRTRVNASAISLIDEFAWIHSDRLVGASLQALLTRRPTLSGQSIMPIAV